MNIIYLGLGSNLGHREENLHNAMRGIEEYIGRIISRSSFYDTAPWGFQSEHRFLNAVVKAETELTPIALLQTIKQLEKELGRKKKSTDGSYADRPIDIDILFYNGLVCKEKELEIPHPHIQSRDFVLQPLTEIAPDLIHPQLHCTIRELWQQLNKQH